MQLTYFFVVCSMWCALGDETIAEVAARYGARAHVTWKIALINGGKPMEAGPAQELWYYDRCAALEAMVRDEEKYAVHASIHPPIPER